MKKLFGHNFGVVYRFEVTRALKKKSFWLAALGIPLSMALIFAVVFVGSKQTEGAIDDLKNEKISLKISDTEKRISPQILAAIGGEISENKSQEIENVKSGKLDAYVIYPTDLKNEKIEIFAKHSGIFKDAKYEAIAETLLRNSVAQTVDPATFAVLNRETQAKTTTFQDGEEYNAMAKIIAPGILLVLFYFLVVLFGPQLLNIVVEEKENRVTEMILTTIRARTLIIGKVFASLTTMLLQAVILLGLIVAGYFLLRGALDLPDVFALNIDWDPMRIIFGVILLFFGIVLIAGLLVCFGAIAPTAKEANQYVGVVMMLIFAPLYLAAMFITVPENPVIQFLSLFPLTSPVPLLLRNAVGNLTANEYIFGIGLLAIATVVVLLLAAKLFVAGVVEYDSKVSLKRIFKKKRA